MPDINDDMDDLFRRAADKYPLNTNSSDWNKVQSAMQLSEKEVQVKSKKKYRRFLWLLLLLPFAFVIEKYGFQNNDKGNSVTQKDKLASAEQKMDSQKNIESKNLKDTQEAIASPVDKRNSSSSTKIIQNKASDKINKQSVGVRIKQSRDVTTEKPVGLTNEIKNVQNKYSSKENSAINKNVVTEDLNKVSQNDVIAIEDKDRNPKAANNDINTNQNNNTNAGNADSIDNVEIKKIENKTAVTNDTLQKGDVTKVHKKINSKKDESAFYIGVIAGPDFSSVKFEKIIKTGYTLGVITGYTFNKKFSIESGILVDKKYYYSEGKYFNPKNVNLPYHAKIENVDGYCNMLELPLNLKYNFKSNKKANWFAVAGISSYFMSKENYDYRYSIYGQQKDSNLLVNDNSKIWASVMNVGVGYSHNIGRTGTLRIEPYIKIPFKGIGTGSLPIMSSGIYFGFTKNLF